MSLAESRSCKSKWLVRHSFDLEIWKTDPLTFTGSNYYNRVIIPLSDALKILDVSEKSGGSTDLNFRMKKPAFFKRNLRINNNKDTIENIA